MPDPGLPIAVPRGRARVVFLGLTLGLAVVVVGAPEAGAQSVVVPNALADEDGNAQNQFPFDPSTDPPGAPGDMRYQQVYAAASFAGLGVPFEIDSIAFRPQGPLDAGTIDSIELRLSTTQAAPDALDSAFDANVGSDETVVFNGALAIPAVPFAPPPQPFAFVIPLAPAFSYDPTAGNLLLEVRNFTGGAAVILDAEETGGDAVSRLFSFSADAATGVVDTYGLVTHFAPEPRFGMLGAAAFAALAGIAAATRRR